MSGGNPVQKSPATVVCTRWQNAGDMGGGRSYFFATAGAARL